MPRKKSQEIGDRIINNYDFLKKVAKTRSFKKRYKLLKFANQEELLAIIEVATNILRGNFCLTNKQKLKLQPFAGYIRKLARIRSERGARQIIKNQKGGQAVLGALLAPVLVEAATRLISKIANNG